MSGEKGLLADHDEWIRCLEISYGTPTGYFVEAYQSVLGRLEVRSARALMLDLVYRMHKKRTPFSPLCIFKIASYAMDVLLAEGFYRLSEDRCVNLPLNDFMRLVDLALNMEDRVKGKSPEEVDEMHPFIAHCERCGVEVALPELDEFLGGRIGMSECLHCSSRKDLDNNG